MLGTLANAFVSYGLNSALNSQNNEYAQQREATARSENYRYNELAADNADKRTRALYNDLYSASAQMQQLKDAGLSPSIYSSNGLAGKSGASGAMGGGSAGISPNVFGMPYMDISQMNMQTAQTDNLRADTEKKKAETEGQEISNADDPVIARYISEKQQAITDANKEEAELTNKAFSDLQSNLTTISSFSKTSNWSISHAEGTSGSDASGWTFSVDDAKGQSHSFNIGGSVSANVGVTGGGGSVSANYGKSEACNTSHGESKGENTAKSWAQNVADTISEGNGESGYNREAVHVLETFYTQVAEISKKCQDNRDEARDIYNYRVERYERNRSRKK